MAGAEAVLLRFGDSRRRSVTPTGETTRLAFVVPWRETGQWAWDYLPDGFSGDIFSTAPASGRRQALPYLGDFALMERQKIRWEQYSAVLTWEMRAAAATAALLRRLPPHQRPAHIIVAPIIKGLLRLPVFRSPVRSILGGAQAAACFSRAECETLPMRYGLPREKFHFVPSPWHTDEPVSSRDGGYILALGHSERDYSTLLRAARGTDLPIHLVTDCWWRVGGWAPPNVRVSFNTGPEETNALIEGASLVCLPLKPTGVSAGQSVLLRSMARGKAVVVTDTVGIRDYVTAGESALLVPPRDPVALRGALRRLWADVEERERIGLRAAERLRAENGWERFVRRLLHVAGYAVEVAAD